MIFASQPAFNPVRRRVVRDEGRGVASSPPEYRVRDGHALHAAR
jgi:hypothetical protein